MEYDFKSIVTGALFLFLVIFIASHSSGGGGGHDKHDKKPGGKDAHK